MIFALNIEKILMALGFNLRFRDDVPQYEDHTSNSSKEENKTRLHNIIEIWCKHCILP